MTAEPAVAGRTGRSHSQLQRRKRILQAAAALASRGGVEAMQMRTVAERAGVALGTLYRYFPSKMDLVVAVADEDAAPGDEHFVLLRSLSSVGVMEMIELLRGSSGDERLQARLELAAERLLAGF